MDPELKKKLYESGERRSILAAIETVRQTPDLIESHGITLENFDSKTKSLFKLNKYLIKMFASPFASNKPENV